MTHYLGAGFAQILSDGSADVWKWIKTTVQTGAWLRSSHVFGTSSDLDGVRLSLLVCRVPALKLDPTTVLAPLLWAWLPLGALASTSSRGPQMRRVIGKTQVREPADGGAGGRSRAIGSEDCRPQLPSVSPAWGEEKPREQTLLL